MNNDLQASYQVINLFEKSKFLSDQILDQIGGIFLNFDAEGNILRSNREAASLSGLPHEDLLGRSVASFFSAKKFEQFKAEIEKTEVSGGQVQFQLAVEVGGQSRTYFWHVNQVNIGSGQKIIRLYTCIGRDISELLVAHAKVVTLAKDLELVEMVQSMFLPATKEFKTADIALTSSYTSAEISSGDYWWFNFISEKKFWVLLGDVTGHGAGAAMVTALIAGSMKTLWSMAQKNGLSLDMPGLLSKIGANLASLPGQLYWMTAVALEVDLETDNVIWWSAAGPAFYHLSASGKVDIVTAETSSPLGAGSDQATGEFKFAKGERIVLVTDGLTEMANRQGQTFNDRRLVQLLQKAPLSLSGAELCFEINSAGGKWRGDMPQNDDVTTLVIDRL